MSDRQRISRKKANASNQSNPCLKPKWVGRNTSTYVKGCKLSSQREDACASTKPVAYSLVLITIFNTNLLNIPSLATPSHNVSLESNTPQTIQLETSQKQELAVEQIDNKENISLKESAFDSINHLQRVNFSPRNSVQPQSIDFLTEIPKESIQLKRKNHAPFNGVDNLTREVPVTFIPGEITRTAEGEKSATLRIHWPNTANSGVTLGYGYDMKTRKRASIITDLTNAGVSRSNAAHLANAAGLKGNDADHFVRDNRAQPWATITDIQRKNLFNQIYPNYQVRARKLATNIRPIRKNGYGVNAAARGQQYVVPEQIYDRLHPVIREILTDLTYPGQYSYSRHENINPILNDYRLSTLEKFRAIRDYLNAATTTGIGRRKRIEARIKLLDQAISKVEERMTNLISERRQQLMGLPPMNSEQRESLQSELESLEDAYRNQHPSVVGLEAVYKEDLKALREQLRNMPEANSEDRNTLENRIRILEQLYGSTN